MLATYTRAVIRYRLWVVLAVLLVTALCITQIRNLRIVIDPNTMLPQHHPYVVGTNLAEKVFGSNYMLVVMVSPKHGDIFTPETLQKVKTISDGLLTIPHLKKETLMSLSAPRAKSIEGVANGMNVRPLMATVPTTVAEMDTLKAAIDRNPLYKGAIVSQDKTAAAITIAVEKGAEGFRPTLERVYQLIDPLKTPEVDIAVSGTPMFISYVEKFAQRMGFLFPLALLIVGLLHFEAFRTWQGFFLPLLTAILSVLWGLGLMGIAKVPMDAFNATTPILILAVTAGHAVQLLKRYYEEYGEAIRRGVEPKQANSDAVVNSMVTVGPVMLAAGIVAVAGFISLVTFDISTIRNFGIFTGLGILSGLIIELTFIPAIRSWLKPPKLAERKPGKLDLWGFIIRKVTTIATGEKRGLIYSFCLLLVLIMGFGVNRISLENSYKSYFSAKLPFQQDDKNINEKMGGTNTLYITFEGQADDAIKDPKVLHLIDDTQRFLEKQEGVGKTLSIADLVKRMNQALHADDPGHYVVPDTKQAISQYLLMYTMSGEPSDFDSYVDYGYRHASITAYLKKDSSLYIEDVIAKAKAFVAAQGNQNVTIHFGGSVPQSAALSEVLVEGKLRNIMQVGIVVLLVSALVFRSLLAGVLVVIPLAVTVFCNFGVMGLAGIPLNTPNSISAAMAIGIGADYAIYLLYRIREERCNHPTLNEAVRAALQTAGRATLYVGSAIAGGYAVLLFSHGFYIHIWFGILIVLSMVISMFSALLLIPLMVSLIKPRFLSSAKENSALGRASASTTMWLLGALVAFSTLTFSERGHAAQISPDQAMERNYLVSRFDDSVSDATYRLINKSGNERMRKTFGATKMQENDIDNKRMTRFLSPADIRNTVILTVEHANADDDIWVYLPALKKTRRLASSNKKESFAGTDFSYGDVIGHRVTDWSHRLLREEGQGGAQCYVIESTPKTSQVRSDSGYSKRITWVDEKNFLPLKAEYYDLQGQLLKVGVAERPVQVDEKKDRWQPMKMEMRNVQTGHCTIIEWDRFKANQGIGDEYFTMRYLEREQ